MDRLRDGVALSIVGGQDGDRVAGVTVAGTGHVTLVDVGEGGRLVQDDVPDVIDLKMFSVLNLSHVIREIGPIQSPPSPWIPWLG